MTSYSPDGTGRDSYIIHKNGGLQYQQPFAEFNKQFVNRLRDYSPCEISYTGRNYNPETGIGTTSKPNEMIKSILMEKFNKITDLNNSTTHLPSQKIRPKLILQKSKSRSNFNENYTLQNLQRS